MARKTVVDVEKVGVYHCIFRWVRKVESYGGLFYRIAGSLESIHPLRMSWRPET